LDFGFDLSFVIRALGFGIWNLFVSCFLLSLYLEFIQNTKYKIQSIEIGHFIRMSLTKVYQPQKIEKKIYRLWEKSGYFNPDKLPPRQAQGKPFCIIMPPPNANAPLHIGHAVFVTLQDLMIRYQRMRGRKTLWLPGSDHAGFETQVVFERKLKEQGKSRLDMSPKEFYRALWKYTQQNRKVVRKQLKLLGASCDWSREKFTLDKDIKKIVYQTLKQLEKDKLLYRGKRIVNYCTYHQTAFSNLEVKYRREKGKLYFIRYPLKGEVNKFIVVATTRPETIPGDTAIAVNPKDKRYKQLVGKTAIEPILQREIPIIADKAVDMNFGTGALKITPAHDPLDFEIGQRHHLPIRATLDFQGYFNDLAGPLAGLTVKEAREKALQLLERGHFLERAEDYYHEVGHCYKCDTVIEPMLMDQWFIDMKKPIPGRGKSLQQLALEAVKSGKIKIIPSYFKKVYFHWLNNIKDWNISRQISWGIPIPAYHCSHCGKSFIHLGKRPSRCPYCGSKDIKADSDVLDTWFSSGQWPFATLMTTKKNDFETFYPTDVMETGWDILFFWVARMIMLGIYRTGKIPFRVVYLNGLVRDKDRKKISKSKGNVVNPLAIAEKYGTDALRMALIIGNSPGKDIVISEDKIRGYRNFANKVWNVSRFALLNLKDFSGKKPSRLGKKDKKILQELKKTEKKVTKYLSNFHFSLAGETIYQYFWHTFADKIIEEMKMRIRENRDKEQAQYIVAKILVDCLKLLHPFMPFLTEAIWQKLPFPDLKKEKILMVAKWPVS